MTKISEYPVIATPELDDLLIGTDANNSDITKNFSIGSIIATIGDINQGPIGPQGNTGPTGPQGPVGPAGLNWQGQWVSGTEYVENDAVGYEGASWFLYVPNNIGSENEPPSDNLSHWALLASQGAVGPTGPAGPIGPQGPQGDVSMPNATVGAVAYTVPNTPLTFDINTVYNNGGTFSLPSLTDNYKGKEIIVQCTATNVLIKPSLLGPTISSTNINGFAGQFQILENQRYRFVYLGNDYWFTEFIDPIAPADPFLPSYKSYVAKVTHSAGNSDPTVVVLENTIGTITPVYEEANNYGFSSSGLFTLNKTVVFITSPSFPLMKVGGSSPNSNFVTLTTDNDGFNNLNIEIRVYN